MNALRIAAAGSALFVSFQAFALPALPGAFGSFYEDQGIDVSPLTAQNCRLCHDGVFPNRGNLNGFGVDVDENVNVRSRDVDFSAIEGLDSDGDGFTNIEEFEAGTLPGDASSRP